MINQVYTLKEVAELAKLSLATIKRVVAAGRLDTIRLGRSVRVRGSDLKAWLEKGDTTTWQAEKGKSAARREREATTKPQPDGATGLAWEKRRQGRRS